MVLFTAELATSEIAVDFWKSMVWTFWNVVIGDDHDTCNFRGMRICIAAPSDKSHMSTMKMDLDIKAAHLVDSNV